MAKRQIPRDPGATYFRALGAAVSSKASTQQQLATIRSLILCLLIESDLLNERPPDPDYIEREIRATAERDRLLN